MSTERNESTDQTHNTHTDNTSKSGFSALETLGQIDQDQATYFTYTKGDGTAIHQLIRYPEVSYQTNFLLKKDDAGIFHSSFAIDNFYFTDRIDEFAVIDPGKRALFVDVGLFDMCGIDFLDGALELTDTPWSETEVFLTHFHDDHDGNARYCLDKGARRVYIGARPHYDEQMTENFLIMTGFEREDLPEVRFYVERLLKRSSIFDGYEDRLVVVKSGDMIEVGDRHFEVIETPGHTVEHISLLERKTGIFFAGDHILDTAPGLMSFTSDLHLLDRFLNNLAYLRSLGLKRVYMCHHDALIGTEVIDAFLAKIIDGYRRPIDKMHSRVEVNNPLTVFELAKRYYSYLPSWTDQPPILLSRRTAIAFSYLEYLYDQGKIERRKADDGAYEYWVEPAKDRRRAA